MQIVVFLKTTVQTLGSSKSYGANSHFLKLRCPMLFFVKLRGELHGEVLSTQGFQKTQKSIETLKTKENYAPQTWGSLGKASGNWILEGVLEH